MTKPPCSTLMMGGADGKTVWTFGGFAPGSLASQLSRTLGVHVVDKTDIADKFVFRFEFTRDPDMVVTEGSVMTSLEDQLGLKLEKTKGPHGFIVIDAIERPTPDGPLVIVSLPSRAHGAGGPR